MDYQEIATQSRLKCLELVYKAQTSHIGSLFSCADIMAVLFEKLDLDQDKFILSAGWKACMLYYHLWRKGRITEDELNSYCQEGSKFIGLAEPIIPEIPFAGGSMGMGLPAAVGFALAKKLKREQGKVYCLMSDGELQIGTTWEAFLIAVQHNLDNLIVICDCNDWQAMGQVAHILDLSPGSRATLMDKVHSFNWEFRPCNGHTYWAIENLLNSDPNGQGKPRFIMMGTIKGKGVGFMEDSNLYHYKQLSEDEYGRARQELRQA